MDHYIPPFSWKQTGDNAGSGLIVWIKHTETYINFRFENDDDRARSHVERLPIRQ